MLNKKVIAFLICMILLGSIGSYAWFTNTVNIGSKLKISAPTLDFKIQGAEEWILQQKDKSEITNKEAKNNFENVKPGDSFIRVATIKNTGTSKQEVSFELNEELPLDFKKIFKIELQDLKKATLIPNSLKSIKIKATLRGEETQNDKQKKVMDFINLNATDIVTIKAIQLD